jgi:hypothetical protein
MSTLTPAQRAQIRTYLGWTARFAQTDTRLEWAMNAIDADPDPSNYNNVTALLTQIQTLKDTTLPSTYGRLKAVEVGSIKISEARGTGGKGEEIAILRSEGRRMVGELAVIFGVEVRHDVFSGSGPSHYTDRYGMHPGLGKGGLPRLG